MLEKKLLHNKGQYKQGEKTAFRMGEIIANEATDKQLISKVYKQLLQLNSSKINDPIKEHVYTCGGFILIFGKTNTIM